MIINTKRGFTLIELLVVIAIIGILSSVVLVSLNTARNKGADAATKSQLAQVRSQAELFYDGNGNSYTGVCSNANVSSQLNGAKNSSGATALVQASAPAALPAGAAGTVTCHDTAGASSAWIAEAPLKSVSGHFWCVDSSGASKDEAAAMLANAVACI
ncbi:MAG TPA: type II secretion system protein [Candidatus Paceibacterota bacterium]